MFRLHPFSVNPGEMPITTVDYKSLSQISATDLAYIKHDPRLRPFYAYEPGAESIPAAIYGRKKFEIDRNLLLEIVKRQYSELKAEIPFDGNMLLDENTFTITTAHQPSLFTGPLYHIYKISSVIHLAKKLNQEFPGQKFIPVFVMSGEDHDWQEINHFHLFGKKYEWEKTASGPCGRFSLDGLQPLIETVNEHLKNTKFGQEVNTLLTSCSKDAKNYGHFHRLLVSRLFDGTDLLVIDLDDEQCKRAFIPLFEKEIKTRFSFDYVTRTQHEIEQAGFKIQAHCRPLNLFYMMDGLRERIDLLGENFVRNGSGVKYSVTELLAELHTHPERFSPNVILRPLYQEFILPNIAYTGGGGEIAYWLERKAQFEAAQVHFPMLIRRNSMLMIDPQTKHSMEKLGMKVEDFFGDVNRINREFIKKHSRGEVDFDAELKMLQQAYKDLAGKAEKIDPTLSKSILAEQAKQVKAFEQLGSRLIRTEKQHQETQLKKVQRIKEKLFPEGGLQERHDNFLGYYADYGKRWIREIIEVADPFHEEFILLELQA